MRSAIITNVHIAVVDSERLTREFVVNVMMYSVNRQILVFEHARDLQAHLETDMVHMVLSEMNLPEVSGFELLRFVKQSHPRTYFIAMSANPGDESAASQMGADVFLAKPFALQDLFNIVERFVVRMAHLKPIHR